MKALHLILVTTSLLALTACQSIRQPAPGNELSEVILHKDFQLVAKDHPEFTAFIINKVTRLEIEQSWANYRKMEAIKERYKKVPRPQPIPPTPPVPITP
jgi:hypothetical protein